MARDASAVFYALLEFTVLLDRDSRIGLAAVGLTAPRAHLLWLLHLEGPSRQHDLARSLDVSARNITGLVDALVVDGFVTREPHPTDRRATLVTLTSHGERVMAEMAAQREQLVDALFRTIPSADIETTSRTLETVRDRLVSLMAGARP